MRPPHAAAANNLSGRCFPVEGGPGGGEALQFTLYFKEGGVGTFIPFFFRSWHCRQLALQRMGLHLAMRTGLSIS